MDKIEYNVNVNNEKSNCAAKPQDRSAKLNKGSSIKKQNSNSKNKKRIKSKGNTDIQEQSLQLVNLVEPLGKTFPNSGQIQVDISLTESGSSELSPIIEDEAKLLQTVDEYARNHGLVGIKNSLLDQNNSNIYTTNQQKIILKNCKIIGQSAERSVNKFFKTLPPEKDVYDLNTILKDAPSSKTRKRKAQEVNQMPLLAQENVTGNYDDISKLNIHQERRKEIVMGSIKPSQKATNKFVENRKQPTKSGIESFIGEDVSMEIDESLTQHKDNDNQDTIVTETNKGNNSSDMELSKTPQPNLAGKHYKISSMNSKTISTEFNENGTTLKKISNNTVITRSILPKNQSSENSDNYFKKNSKEKRKLMDSVSISVEKLSITAQSRTEKHGDSTMKKSKNLDIKKKLNKKTDKKCVNVENLPLSESSAIENINSSNFIENSPDKIRAEPLLSLSSPIQEVFITDDSDSDNELILENNHYEEDDWRNTDLDDIDSEHNNIIDDLTPSNPACIFSNQLDDVDSEDNDNTDDSTPPNPVCIISNELIRNQPICYDEDENHTLTMLQEENGSEIGEESDLLCLDLGFDPKEEYHKEIDKYEKQKINQITKLIRHPNSKDIRAEVLDLFTEAYGSKEKIEEIHAEIIRYRKILETLQNSLLNEVESSSDNVSKALRLIEQLIDFDANVEPQLQDKIDNICHEYKKHAKILQRKIWKDYLNGLLNNFKEIIRQNADLNKNNE